MTRKTDVEVQAEIAALSALLPNLPQRACRAIGGALEVLREHLSHDDVYDKFEEGTEEFEDALAARMWRDGVSGGDALSVQYRDLM